MSLNKPIRRIAIVGTGVIGASWAALCLARGLDVTATDPAPDAEANLRRYIDTAWPVLATLGLSPKASPEHLWFTADLRQAVMDADFVQESAPEDRALKLKLFAAIDAAAPPDSVIASSSSGVSISILQAACKGPERCVIGHPLNPPHIIPLVEVVGGDKTSPEAVQQAIAFYAAAGKRPIHLRKEVAGHVSNRLQAALYREVTNLIAQEVIDVAAADTAVCWGHGLRWGIMGPNLLFHLESESGGVRQFLDRFGSSMTGWWEDLGNPELTSQLRQTIIDGAIQVAGDRPVAQLARERDEVLLRLIQLRRGFSAVSPTSARLKRGT